MSNDANASLSPTLEPSEIQIVLAGNIADDDLMWIVRCSLRELHRLFLDPIAWVASLGSLPDWRYAGSTDVAPPPVLLPGLALTVREATAPDPDGWVTVYGISETDAIVVLATRDAAVASAALLGHYVPPIDPLARFWSVVGANLLNHPASVTKALLVNVVPALGRFVAHFEIVTDDWCDPTERAGTVATFLLAFVFDPVGFAGLLSRLDQRALYVRGGERTVGKPIRIAPLPGAATLVGVYANLGVSLHELGGRPFGPDDGPVPSPSSCLVLDGPYGSPTGTDEGGTGSPSGGTIKKYGNESD